MFYVVNTIKKKLIRGAIVVLHNQYGAQVDLLSFFWFC